MEGIYTVWGQGSCSRAFAELEVAIQRPPATKPHDRDRVWNLLTVHPEPQNPDPLTPKPLNLRNH